MKLCMVEIINGGIGVDYVPNNKELILLVFYIGNILVDKNTLCNGCFLTGLSVLFRVFK
jgi:hypothetical protein